MPWQSMVNAVANEVREDGSFRYSTLVVSTPRQSGKTTWLGGLMAHRALTMHDWRGYYTAQTGQSARDTWYEWQRLLSAKMPGRWKFRLSNGEETARWQSTGGFIKTFPPTPESLHGKQSDLVALDEVWSYSVDLGTALTQAVVPTQATRPRRQLAIISTAGDETSDWMRAWIERARIAALDPDSTIAYFEWSAPGDAPFDSPETWATYHPAYGITQTEESFSIALDQMGEAQFRRAYLNQWPAAATSWRACWTALESGDIIPTTAPVFVAADASPNLGEGTIVAAGQLLDGRTAVEVVDHHKGVDWILPRLVEISRRHRCTVTLARTGPLGYMIEELQRAGVRVQAATATDYADAVARFQTLVVAGMITHQGDPHLAQAVANCKDTSTERPTWRRKDARVDISSLVAATFATWQAATPPQRPKVRS